MLHNLVRQEMAKVHILSSFLKTLPNKKNIKKCFLRIGFERSVRSAAVTAGNSWNDKRFDDRPSSRYVAAFGPPRDDQNSRTLAEFWKRSKNQTSKKIRQNRVSHNLIRQETAKIHVPSSVLKTLQNQKRQQKMLLTNRIRVHAAKTWNVPEGNSRNDKWFNSRPSSVRVHLHFRHMQAGQPSPEGLSGVRRPSHPQIISLLPSLSLLPPK